MPLRYCFDFMQCQKLTAQRKRKIYKKHHQSYSAAYRPYREHLKGVPNPTSPTNQHLRYEKK